jgi:hypothetical protein
MASSGHHRTGPTPLVERLVGKLLVTRVGQLRSTEEWVTFSRRFFAAVEASPGPVVVCADYRAMQLIDDATATTVIQDLRRGNARVLRSAFLLPVGSSTVRLQVDRLLREAGNPERRTCSDPAEAKAWLGLRLDAAERAALDRFLASLPVVSALVESGSHPIAPLARPRTG